MRCEVRRAVLFCFLFYSTGKDRANKQVLLLLHHQQTRQHGKNTATIWQGQGENKASTRAEQGKSKDRAGPRQGIRRHTLKKKKQTQVPPHAYAYAYAYLQ